MHHKTSLVFTHVCMISDFRQTVPGINNTSGNSLIARRLSAVFKLWNQSARNESERARKTLGLNFKPIDCIIIRVTSRKGNIRFPVCNLVEN